MRFLCAGSPCDGEVASRKYLFRIATNLLRDHWRHSRTIPIDELPLERSAARDTSNQTDSRLTLEPAMAKLRPRDRQLLWLAHAENYSHREIADITGLAVTSIRLLLFRARREMAASAKKAERKVAMSSHGCSRLDEVQQALALGHWPQACPANFAPTSSDAAAVRMRFC